jgi:hypothetical protein
VDTVDYDGIAKAFDDFKSSRPEYIVGMAVPKEIIETSGDNIVFFEELVYGCMLLTVKNEGKAIKIAQKYLDWLRTTDFAVAPASTVFHDAIPEGLLRHHLRTVNHIVALLELRRFKDVEAHEIILAGLLHDVCKVHLYEKYLRNVKDEATGVWSQVPAYRYRASPTPLGHGCSSLYISKKYFNLTMEQALAIRWHMGAWNVAQTESYDLSEANNYPMVQLLQWADQASVTTYGQEA